jgi:hypothetical protein
MFGVHSLFLVGMANHAIYLDGNHPDQDPE